MKTLTDNIKNQIQHFENQLPLLSEADQEMTENKIKEYKQGLEILSKPQLNSEIEHYKATCARGVITHRTTIVDFAEKLCEELEEVRIEYEKHLLGEKNNLPQELTDVKAVINNGMIHFGINPVKEMIINIEKQRNRKD